MIETPSKDGAPETDGGRATVVVADPIHEAGIGRLREHCNVELLFEVGDEDARRAIVARADAIVVRTYATDAAWMEGAARLKLIAKHGSGVDNIDIDAASRHGILVANTPGGANATSVAEGSVMLMLAVLRRMREMDACVRENRFQDRWQLQLRDLWGKTLGLVGLGRIGAVAARICGAGFNMRVLAYDPFVSDDEAAKLGVEKCGDLRDLMARADVVSVHVPLSAEARHLIGEAELSAMKPSAILVNTSRGGVVDEESLIAALKRGRIAGAGVDVFEREPPDPANPLLAMTNVVLSPHVAGVTEDSLRGMALDVAKVVVGTLAGDRPATLLNANIWERRRQ